MLRGDLQKFNFCANYFKCKRNGVEHFGSRFCHSSGECQEQVLPFEWYEKVFPKMTQLAHQLKDVDLIDGRLVNVSDDSIIINEHIEKKMHTLKSLVRAFIGSSLVQQKLRKNVEALSRGENRNQVAFFGKPTEREIMVVNSLTKVGNFLNISAQQRKVVRFTLCSQVTQHRIWRGALKEILRGLKSEMDCWNYQCSGKGNNMEQQVIYACLKFLDDTDISNGDDSTSWMRLSPTKNVNSVGSNKWEDVLDMFNDLIRCLDSEKRLLYHVSKLEVMKEGLFQIKDVLVDKSIGYKEARHQESLVQKKLSKTLGHSSRCLFTLLLYYLYGKVRDVEVDLSGGIYDKDGGGNRLYMGRILTADEEKMVWIGVKQLDRALGLFKFVWETAGMKGDLELQGHLWCVGAKDRTLTYRGNLFFVHGINL